MKSTPETDASYVEGLSHSKAEDSHEQVFLRELLCYIVPTVGFVHSGALSGSSRFTSEREISY